MKPTLDGTYIIEELEGDTLTPISIFQRMSGRKKFLLESSLKHEKSGRYSFIGADPVMELKGEGNRTAVTARGKTEVFAEKPLDVVRRLMPEQKHHPFEQFPFCGGAVGYAGYDVIRQYEDIGTIPYDELNVPDVHLMFFEEVAVFDHLEQKVYLVGMPLLEETDESQLREKIQKRKAEIQKGTAGAESEEATLSAFKASISKEDFVEKVNRAKSYIEEGDIFQVVLSQRLKAELTGDPFAFYRKLRVQNPSPYMYYLDFEEYAVAGASPESLIKAAGNKVITNPIAGTRPRGKSEEEDLQLERDLIEDEKELAEHRMLLDLGRNDLGRVCEFGSVTIEKNMVIERYKHVMHLVSEVGGRLKNPHTSIDALIACLPAGTVSGAPKIRAMEVINELETVKRGIYSGAVGYFSGNGNMDFALAIRTMVIKDGYAYIQAGAGIVHDSIPEKEYEETLHKLKAFLEDKK
ncbi:MULTISPECIES: anthranilate synthase component I [Cytobacillus]|uniref:Anthranilate synthase component 1 n=1 Tax=Cytobacillus firmus TaxID=1399 RepID=A0AA46PHQ9_CYTFI|nr:MULTISPECIES: anthranilate synthase component I [Cytobacillus]MCC3647228.1 anthranilate synthase component I [Cytobacillus oceanisediminis]MCU1806753.1 anthranilate synthase component I [Cytobacillus firmus]UYG94993.1 anthranilate synthase component I [Cytobacillus firmus]